jgi:hypothetical protein
MAQGTSPNPPPKKPRASNNGTVAMHYLKMSPMKPDSLPGCMAEIFFSSFFSFGSADVTESSLLVGA